MRRLERENITGYSLLASFPLAFYLRECIIDITAEKTNNRSLNSHSQEKESTVRSAVPVDWKVPPFTSHAELTDNSHGSLPKNYNDPRNSPTITDRKHSNHDDVIANYRKHYPHIIPVETSKSDYTTAPFNSEFSSYHSRGHADYAHRYDGPFDLNPPAQLLQRMGERIINHNAVNESDEREEPRQRLQHESFDDMLFKEKVLQMDQQVEKWVIKRRRYNVVLPYDNDQFVAKKTQVLGMQFALDSGGATIVEKFYRHYRTGSQYEELLNSFSS